MTTEGKQIGVKVGRCAEESAYVALLTASERLKSRFTDLFKASDLTQSQYNVLRILRGAGEPGLSCSEVSGRMISSDPDMTRMLDRLEARGLLRRERQTDDRRVVLTFITESGLELLAALDEPVIELNRANLGHLTGSELGQLTELLRKVIGEAA